jgi:hypothetical protein
MDKQSLGYIVSVRGTVIDIEFATQLPQVRHVLKAGPERNVSLEVQTQLNEHTVRAIALNPTSGLAKYCIQQQMSGTANKSQTYIYFTIVPVLPLDNTSIIGVVCCHLIISGNYRFSSSHGQATNYLSH